MWHHRNNKLKQVLLGLSIALNLSVNAQTLQLWKVGKPVPLFYKEAVESSQKLTDLKPAQSMIILAEQKNWKQLLNLETKEIGWVNSAKLAPRVVINVEFNQVPHAYSYYLKIQNPEGVRISEGKIGRSNLDSKNIKRRKTFAPRLAAKLFDRSHLEDSKIIEEMFMNMMEHFWMPFPVIQPTVILSSSQSTTSDKPNKEALQIEEKRVVPEPKVKINSPTLPVSDNSTKQEGE